ncbi:helix-turn-helix transcriptional regulator (plasmid) [Serratia ureilytica]|uniref:helix-turn-helix transcriptional regulator n=1 Tax=Serratia ureilytica TaxID=300181 RepID=UPI001CC1A91F|nr:helix-turn-helix transcriptional regulator [Serratia ureilytica]UAN29728.1 helix-turn-helix transcriptional regulator [Serratia ureilytica]
MLSIILVSNNFFLKLGLDEIIGNEFKINNVTYQLFFNPTFQCKLLDKSKEIIIAFDFTTHDNLSNSFEFFLASRFVLTHNFNFIGLINEQIIQKNKISKYNTNKSIIKLINIRNIKSEIKNAIFDNKNRRRGVKLTSEAPSPLTQAEKDVLVRFMRGMRVKDVAVEMHKSIKTVSTQKRSVMKKTGALNDIQLFYLFNYKIIKI